MDIESIFRALADPTRLRIMRLLADIELAVGELAQVLGQSQPRVSRHVGILHEAGLIERRREGSWTFVRQGISENAPQRFEVAVAVLLASAEGGDAIFAARCAEDRRHLAAIRESREQSADEFFARHARDWDDLRALLGSAESFDKAIRNVLAGKSLGRVLDIGTGTGRIAELLAGEVERVVALDRSTEMLRVARARLQRLPFESWELVQGDLNALPFEPASFDAVIFHQVLHYVPDPAAALKEAAHVCRPGGLILIADLAQHEREELRNRFAHVRLGFTDEQMLGLLSEAGFNPETPLTVPGKELTNKIWSGKRMPEGCSVNSRSARNQIHQ